MDESPFEELLQKNFPKTNKKNWEQVAIVELNGAEHLKQLTFKHDDQLEFFAYHDQTAVEHLNYLTRYCVNASENSFSGAAEWSNLPSVSVNESVSANRKAIDHLQNGADGILFEIREKFYEASSLLKDIQPQYCVLSFEGALSEAFITSVFQSFRLSNTPSEISGYFFWEEIPHLRLTDPIVAYKNFKTLGLRIKTSTATTEVADALSKGVEMIKRFSSDASIEEIIRSIAFSLPVHNNFMLDSAKLKALRILWYQVAHAYKVYNYKISDLKIHARSEKFKSDSFDPQGNMIKSTLSGMSAVIGTCNALTIYPEDRGNTTMDRIARNVSNILREESHLDKVADPLAGSYAHNAMIDALCRNAWKLFQSSQTK